MVILQGNGGSIRNQGRRIAFFSKNFEVIAINSRAHGHSVDPSGDPLTYTQMANDMKVLLVSLQVASAYY